MTADLRLALAAAYTNVHEALLARSVLEGAGIDAVLQNEHVVSMAWTYSNLVGGVRVLVPESRLAEAQTLLMTPATIVSDPEQPLDDPMPAAGDTCHNCGSDDFESVLPAKRLAILSWLVFGIPVGSAVRRRFCRRCGAPAPIESGA